MNSDALELSALIYFVRESNRIEGIGGNPSKAALEAHAGLLACRPRLFMNDVMSFVNVIAPGNPLRRERGMNVRVGDHIPPRGGQEISFALIDLLERINDGCDPWEAHIAYETLHPFMDGNGRSGRAIWLWQMIHQQRAPWALRRGFLHLFYYQTLQHSGPRRHNARDGATHTTSDQL